MNSSTIKAAAAILYLEKLLKYLSFYPKKNRGNRPRKQGLDMKPALPALTGQRFGR